MRTVYIADDGTKFDNEIECEQYERKEKLKDNTIIMLDGNNKILDNNIENFESCLAISIKNRKDLDIVYYMGDYTGCSCPYDTGDFYYNTYNHEWEYLDTKIKDLEAELNSYKIIKEKLNNGE